MKQLYLLPWFLIITICSFSQRDFSGSDITKLVLLGTGNPNPSPDQSGCALAVFVNDVPYIVDFGPGLIRRAAALSPSYGGSLEGMNVKNIKRAFLTHLHSDHTAGYPDLILTPWVMGRDEPLEFYGPSGIAEMTKHILEAYQDKNIRVEAFQVPHGTWPNAWGFRFTTPDRVIVISGDSAPSDKIIEYAKGADILVHEVYSKAGYDSKSESWKSYHAAHHTSSLELADIANQANPEILVLYHILFWGSTEDELQDEISGKYKGKLMVGRDLDIF